MIAVVTGMIATYPVGGIAWDYGQYAIGLEQLGFEVYYLEDTGLPSYHADPPFYLRQQLSMFSNQLSQSWHYRTPENQTYGLSQIEIEEVVQSADLLLNVSGGCLLRDAYMRCPRKVLIDTDPGLNHFVNYPKWDREPGWQGTYGYRGHDYFLTYAENFGERSCPLPSLGLEWVATRPPVIMDRWKSEPPGDKWTTVMSWSPYRHYRQPISYQRQTYGAKEMEFERIEALPQRVKVPLEVAVAGNEAPCERWRQLGWQTLDAAAVSGSSEDYRSYIQRSRGEFSVAKNVYVATQSGWSSCRSVCYLASGRPVVLQDTGFSRHIPVGEGLMAYTNLDEAAAAVEAVEARYEQHQRCAREVAAAYFDSRVVIRQMLKDIGLE